MKIEKRDQDYYFNNKIISSYWNINKNLINIYNKLLKILYKNQINLSEEILINFLKSIDIFENTKYHRCWAAEYFPYWFIILKPIIEKLYADKKTLNILQIGVFEGMSLLYLIKIILSNFNVNITVIDNFSTEPYFNTKINFNENTKDFKYNLITDDSHTALLNLISNKQTFDYVYYSGSRKPYVIFTDLALLTKIATTNTSILIDEYGKYSSYENDLPPNIVRNTFLDSFKRLIDVENIGKQKLIIFKQIEIDKYPITEKNPDCVNYKYEYEKYKNEYNRNKNQNLNQNMPFKINN